MNEYYFMCMEMQLFFLSYWETLTHFRLLRRVPVLPDKIRCAYNFLTTWWLNNMLKIFTPQLFAKYCLFHDTWNKKEMMSTTGINVFYYFSNELQGIYNDYPQQKITKFVNYFYKSHLYMNRNNIFTVHMKTVWYYSFSHRRSTHLRCYRHRGMDAMRVHQHQDMDAMVEYPPGFTRIIPHPPPPYQVV